MKKSDEKEALCRQHTPLLHILLRYGGGAILQPQLRALCLSSDLYPSEQAVNRAVRDLRAAGILTRQTWVDHNSDLLLARKYVVRYFSGGDSQSTATPHRPSTMAPYIQQTRKIDWLLSVIGAEKLNSIRAVENYLVRHACTVFLRLPDLLPYYHHNASTLARKHPERYREQVTRLEVCAAQRAAIARCGSTLSEVPQVVTLEQAHRRGIYIANLQPQTKAVALAIFPPRRAKAECMADWAIDAYQWLVSLLPYYRALVTVYALDANHKQALSAAFSAPMGGMTTNYWHYRLQGCHMEDLLHLRIENTDFPARWCGGIHRIDI